MSRNKLLIYNFGKRLGYLRKLKGYSQEELAEKVNTASGYISQIECGRSNLSLEKIGAIADALDIDAEQLFKFL